MNPSLVSECCLLGSRAPRTHSSRGDHWGPRHIGVLCRCLPNGGRLVILEGCIAGWADFFLKGQTNIFGVRATYCLSQVPSSAVVAPECHRQSAVARAWLCSARHSRNKPCVWHEGAVCWIPELDSSLCLLFCPGSLEVRLLSGKCQSLSPSFVF